MKVSVRQCLHTLLILFAVILTSVPARVADAAENILVLATQVVADDAGEVQSFWWATGSTPQWTQTDEALKSAMVQEGAGFAEPSDLGSLSKIYRRPAPSDANALAMASVFGRSRVLVGTIRYEPTTLRPVGLVGWSATVDLRLLSSASTGQAVERRLKFSRAMWARSDEEVLTALREQIATAVGQVVAGGLKRKTGPVGVDSDELLIGVQTPGSRRAIDAVRAKLETLGGVTSARERWAAEGVVVLEVNPLEVDPEDSVRQYASLLGTEGVEGFTIQTTQSPWSNVVMFRLQEAVQ